MNIKTEAPDSIENKSITKPPKRSNKITDYFSTNLKIEKIETHDNNEKESDKINNENVLKKKQRQEKISKSTERTYTRLVDRSLFELITCKKINITKSYLLIFTSIEKTHYYEYAWRKTTKKYHCMSCANMRSLTAIVSKNIYGEDNVHLNQLEHVCKPKEFNRDFYADSPEIYKPDYKFVTHTVNGVSNQMIIVFDSYDRNLIYTFTYNQKRRYYFCSKCNNVNHWLQAHVCYDENNQEYITLNKPNHLCQPSPYLPEKYEPKKIIRLPDYELLTRISNQKIQQRLIIFCKNDRSMCYEYFQMVPNDYCCHTCYYKVKKRVSAKLIHDEKNCEDYIELSHVKHLCEPMKYIPDDLARKIIKKPNFLIEEYKKYDGTQRKRLAIFSKEDPKLCNFFHYSIPIKRYVCNGCDSKVCRKSTIAFALNDEFGEEYIQLGDNEEHVCKPQIYIPIKDGNQIITKPDFKLEYFTRLDGYKSKHLTIYNTKNKNLCYKFYFLPSKNWFVCYECEKLHKYFTAKLHQKDNGEEYIEIYQGHHVCKPQKEDRTLLKEEFELTFEKGNTVPKTIILYTQDKKQFYEFFANKGNCYTCRGCNHLTLSGKKEGNKSFIRIFENENKEYYVKVGGLKHICKPIKL